MAYLDTKIAVEKIICNRGHQTWPLHVGASEATFFLPKGFLVYFTPSSFSVKEYCSNMQNKLVSTELLLVLLGQLGCIGWWIDSRVFRTYDGLRHNTAFDMMQVNPGQKTVFIDQQFSFFNVKHMASKQQESLLNFDKTLFADFSTQCNLIASRQNWNCQIGEAKG